MDTVLISLISRFLFILILASCSSTKVELHDSAVDLDRALKSLPKEDAPRPPYGPTSPHPQGFIDKTLDYGLGGIEAVWFASIDLNHDQYDDLVILPGYFNQPKFFVFNPTQKKFLEVESSFPEATPASYLAFADFNRDGVMDVIIGVLNQRGEFTKTPLTLWLGRWNDKNQLRFDKDNSFIKLEPQATSSVVMVDVNLDGRLDLFMGNWYKEHKNSLIPSGDRLLINTANGWEDKSEWLEGENTQSANELFPPLARPTYGASSCDMNQDGWPDILTASSGGHGNKLWLNRAPRPGPVLEGRRFTDVGRESFFAHDANGGLVPTGGGRTFTANCADYNDDGIMDVFLGELTHAWDNVSVDRSSILTGARPTLPLSFLRTEYMSDLETENWNQGDKRATWADLNLDGFIDLLVDNSGFPPHSRLVAFMQDETRAFNNVAPQWGIDIVNPVGSMIVDINGDGKLDIITGQTNVRQSDIKGRIYVLENNMPVSGRAHVFHLEGRKANNLGIGAMVMLYTLVDGKQVIQRRWNETVQGGLSSQNQTGVHFGVGAATKTVGVKVRWPILKSGSIRSGDILERMYQLKENPKKSLQVWTLCEDGRAIEGRFKCNPI